MSPFLTLTIPQGLISSWSYLPQAILGPVFPNLGFLTGRGRWASGYERRLEFKQFVREATPAAEAPLLFSGAISVDEVTRVLWRQRWEMTHGVLCWEPHS